MDATAWVFAWLVGVAVAIAATALERTDKVLRRGKFFGWTLGWILAVFVFILAERVRP